MALSRSRDFISNVLEDARADALLLPFRHANHLVGKLRVKRVLDVISSACLLVVLSPLLMLVALAIKLDSPGPVLFRQERVNAAPHRMGKLMMWRRTRFTVLKFRTMVPDADQSVHATAVKAYASGESGLAKGDDAPYKLTNDPRVTRLGKLLRRTSIDELPQLFNVLKGDMSLVGPRPLPLYEVSEYLPWHMERLCSRPGLTGLWQVHGRGRTSFDEATAMDIEYVRRWSLALDLSLLIKTIPAILSSRGAR